MLERLRVLLADDEPLIRSKVLLMLGDKFQIDQAPTAKDAREAFDRPFDAVLMDIVFPDGNGIELCREIKQKDPHSTVVITSSMESVDAWNNAFQAGADGYLEKRELLGLDPRKTELMVHNLVERNRLRRQAEETNRRQAELLSVLSHDVRAPFQALLGMIDLIRKSSIPSDTAENAETLYQCAKDQLGFINSLLELLRLESGNTNLRRMSLDFNLPVHQSLQSMSILAREKDICLEKDLQQGLPPIPGDLGRILQVVNNLVSNAIKFTPRGGTVKVSTSARENQGCAGVELAVEDSGIGISREEQEKIFHRFHRGRERGTNGEKGTGLGLAICKEIVQQHDGALEVLSDKSCGTTMKVWFPASTDTAFLAN